MLPYGVAEVCAKLYTESLCRLYDWREGKSSLRAYSEKKLLQAELKGRSPIIKLISPSTVCLKLITPNDVLFRARNLCEDVTLTTTDRYRIDDLMQLLLDDIVDHVRRTQDVKGLHQLFLDRDKSTINVRLKYYNNESEETVPLYPIIKPKKEDDFEMVFIRLNRDDILRMEVLFSDMSTVFPNHHFTVERILEILLIDFIEKYKCGEAKNIITSAINK